MFSYFKNVLFQSSVCRRCFHTTEFRRLDHKTVEVITIKETGRRITGKRWGKKTGVPIIAIHGRYDNATSWDPLAKLLPDHLSVFAVDLPGRTSPFRDMYSMSATAIDILKDHFGLSQINLLGHAEGSLVCLLYAASYPQDVASVFGIDNVLFGARKSKTQIADSVPREVKITYAHTNNTHIDEIFKKRQGCLELEYFDANNQLIKKKPEKILPFLLDMIDESYNL